MQLFSHARSARHTGCLAADLPASRIVCAMTACFLTVRRCGHSKKSIPWSALELSGSPSAACPASICKHLHSDKACSAAAVPLRSAAAGLEGGSHAHLSRGIRLVVDAEVNGLPMPAQHSAAVACIGHSDLLVPDDSRQRCCARLLCQAPAGRHVPLTGLPEVLICLEEGLALQQHGR